MTVLVDDPATEVDSATVTVDGEVWVAVPDADLQASVDHMLCFADASASVAGDNPIATYTFRWGDGATTGPQVGATAEHTYATTGGKTITVIVTDSVGHTGEASAWVYAGGLMGLFDAIWVGKPRSKWFARKPR